MTATITIRNRTHNWNESAQHYDRDQREESGLPAGFMQWMGLTTNSFKSVAGAKRSVLHSKEDADFVITEERFEGRKDEDGGNRVQVWVMVKYRN